MSKTDKATARPWKLDSKNADVTCEDGWPILRSRYKSEQRANAEIIVRAVNSFEAMKKAIYTALEYIEHKDGINEGDIQEGLRKALELAKGRVS